MLQHGQQQPDAPAEAALPSLLQLSGLQHLQKHRPRVRAADHVLRKRLRQRDGCLKPGPDVVPRRFGVGLVVNALKGPDHEDIPGVQRMRRAVHRKAAHSGQNIMQKIVFPHAGAEAVSRRAALLSALHGIDVFPILVDQKNMLHFHSPRLLFSLLYTTLCQRMQTPCHTIPVSPALY